MKRAWSHIQLLVVFGFLLALQWPFRKVADALDGPLNRLQDQAEKMLGEPK